MYKYRNKAHKALQRPSRPVLEVMATSQQQQADSVAVDIEALHVSFMGMIGFVQTTGAAHHPASTCTYASAKLPALE